MDNMDNWFDCNNNGNCSNCYCSDCICDCCQCQKENILPFSEKCTYSSEKDYRG